MPSPNAPVAPLDPPQQPGPRLRGKVCVITGAARGIGAACARLFHTHGAEVWLTDIDDAADEAARLNADGQGRAHAARLDVRSKEAWAAVMERVRAAGRGLHVVVNNAGIIGDFSRPQDVEHVGLEDWREVHATNVEGVVLGCAAAIEAMKPGGWSGRGGSIVNVSSRSGVVGIPTAAAYASSKAAVRNHTKSVALWCGQRDYGIRCNVILPATVITPLWDVWLGEGEARAHAIAELESEVPLGRVGVPMDVAYAALFLASDESTYMTGAELTLDGGILAGSSAAPKKR